jgi:hypothetical protein
VIRDQALSNVAIVVHHKDGQSLTCVISSRLIKVGDQPCIVTTLRDITQQQRSKPRSRPAKRNSPRRSTPAPTRFPSPSATPAAMEVNDGFCRLTGYRAEEAIGLTVYQIGIWADDKQRSALLAELQRGRIHHRKCSGATSAAILTVEVSVEPITLNETPACC